MPQLWRSQPDPAHHAVGPFDVLLPGLSEMIAVRKDAPILCKMCKTLDGTRQSGVEGANHLRDQNAN